MRRVPFHEPLTEPVPEDATLTTYCLGDQDAQLVHAGRVELEELHILQRNPSAPRNGQAVAGEGVGVAGDFPDSPPTAGGEVHRFCMEDVQFASVDFVGDNATDDVVFDYEIDDLKLVVEVDSFLDGLLVEGLQNHVASAVCREASPVDRFAGHVVGVPAKAPLVDFAVGRPVKRQTHVLQPDDCVDSRLGQHIDSILVCQVIATFDGIKGVPLPVIFFEITQGGCDTTLSGAGVGAGGVELADNRHTAIIRGVEGCRKPRPAGPYHNRVVPVYFDIFKPFIGHYQSSLKKPKGNYERHDEQGSPQKEDQGPPEQPPSRCLCIFIHHFPPSVHPMGTGDCHDEEAIEVDKTVVADAHTMHREEDPPVLHAWIEFGRYIDVDHTESSGEEQENPCKPHEEPGIQLPSAVGTSFSTEHISLLRK